MTATERPPAVMAAECAHCGLPVPASRLASDGLPSFCCAGCQSVHALLREHGLERYYALHRETGPPPGPARPSDRTYAELDDPALGARIGGPAPDGLARAELFLEGVHCAACVWLVERLPRLVPGVIEARLDLGRSRAGVLWDPAAVALSGIARALDCLLYTSDAADEL